MFERFTEQARRVVVLSQDEARRLDHGYIGVEHLFLGLVRQGEGSVGRVLAAAGVTLDAARAEVERVVGRGDTAPSGHIPFTRTAKKSLELSLRQALELGHHHIGPEHVLLGLLAADDPTVDQILGAFGTDAAGLKAQSMTLIAVTAPVRAGKRRRWRKPAEEPEISISPELSAVIGEAALVAQQSGAPHVTPDHVLDAAARWSDGAAAGLLRAAGIDPSELPRAVGDAADEDDEGEGPAGSDEPGGGAPDEGGSTAQS